MTARLAVGLVGLALLAAPAGIAPAAQAADAAVITIDAATPLGPVNRALVGVGWHPGGPPLTTLAALQPRVVRIDASLQDVSSAPTELHLAPLLEHVAEVRAVGAEPLVILSYMPAWLGAPNAHGRDPTKVPPADLDAWEQLVHDVVRSLATAPAPARRFEAWNEPDIPIFWQDTPEAWAEMVTRSARAVARVEVETGLDLAFGGPATAVPDPVYLAAFLGALRDPALPLDFVSWHYYANTPFFGPDGNEFPVAEPVAPVIGQRNPLASPIAYGMQVGLMRDWTTAALAGSSRPPPQLIVDEWNLSAGGFDFRHDSHENAAFAAGTLIEMQQAGLDASAFFQATDAPPPADVQADTYGGHGLVTRQSIRKPAWWAFWLWQEQAAERVLVADTAGLAAGGLWVTAARNTDRVTVLAASFSASQPTERSLDLVFTGLPWSPVRATVRRIDANHPDADTPEPVILDGTRVRVELPAQAVALVELYRADAADALPTLGAGPTGPSSRLPATGGRATATAGLVMLGIALSARWLGRMAGRLAGTRPLP